MVANDHGSWNLSLNEGDGVLRTQNLQRNKTLPLVLKPWRLTDAILKTVCGMFSVGMQMMHVISGTPETSAL